MTNFVPLPMDRKKKDKDEDGGEDDVGQLTPNGPLPVQSGDSRQRLTALLCVSADQL